MFIDPNWRIMVVGDGDFSFSAALAKNYQPRQLLATIYDSQEQLTDKYGDGFYRQLTSLALHHPVAVMTQFDVTQEQAWQALAKDCNQFDVIIFQFPLVPGYTSKAEFEGNGRIDSNLRNRRLLHQFLKNAFKYGLDPQGAGLIYISSKDVKPYSEWDIEHSLHLTTELTCIGKVPFAFTDFPGYQMRNVDRDKFVKDTASYTYIWRSVHNTQTLPAAIEQVVTPPQPRESSQNRCNLCQAGPFHSQQEQNEHLASKRHQKLQGYQQRWLDDLGLTDPP